MRTSLTAALLSCPLVFGACTGDEKASTPAGGASPATAAATPGPRGTASISGRVTYAGPVPAPQRVPVSADPYCEDQNKGGLFRRTIEVKDGGLANAFVYVKSGVTGAYPPPSDPVLLAQKGCTYHPHVLGVQAGQPLRIRNDDDTLHNVHPQPKNNAAFNIAQPDQGHESLKTFDKPELMIPIGCDVHPWMRAYISVVDTPFFAVTDEEGRFEIKGLPAGEYEVEVVHEKLDKATGKVSVRDGQPAKLDLAYKG